MPILPTAGTTSSVAPTDSTTTITGSTVMLLLTGTGNPGLQPHTMAVPLVASVANSDPMGDTLNENVDMTEPHDEVALAPTMEMDNS
jgi:hypothetical protein